jgi:hypothetical protein
MTTLFAVALFAGLGMMAWYFILMQLRKETGPWVVTRVDMGSVEFFDHFHRADGWAPWWTINPNSACHFTQKKNANKVAKDLTADVHPLSRYVGGVR